MKQVQRAELPERRSLLRQYHQVHGPIGKIPLNTICLSAGLLQIWTHYDVSIRRPVPCWGEGECPFCNRNHERRLTGYFAALRWDTKQLCVTQCTEGVVCKLEELGYLPSKLKGKGVTLYRMGADKNSPVMVKVNDKPKIEILPDEFDPLPHLFKLWGIWEERRAQLEEKHKPRGVDVRGLLGPSPFKRVNE